MRTGSRFRPISRTSTTSTIRATRPKPCRRPTDSSGFRSQRGRKRSLRFLMDQSPAGTPVLSMRGIDKHFSGVQALKAASLEVLPGEIMALVGQNGAGKSTLIKVLTGAYRKDAGEILFEGSPVEFGAPQEAQRAGIS